MELLNNLFFGFSVALSLQNLLYCLIGVSVGTLITGESFKTAAELLDILGEKKRNDFVKCLTDKMLTYALGRGMDYFDRCALDQIAANLARHDYRFSRLVLEIVKSAPFQLRRGESPN